MKFPKVTSQGISEYDIDGFKPQEQDKVTESRRLGQTGQDFIIGSPSHNQSGYLSQVWNIRVQFRTGHQK